MLQIISPITLFLIDIHTPHFICKSLSIYFQLIFKYLRVTQDFLGSFFDKFQILGLYMSSRQIVVYLQSYAYDCVSTLLLFCSYGLLNIFKDVVSNQIPKMQ